MLKKWGHLDARMTQWLHLPQQLILLVMRMMLAWIFFKSGVLKLQTWDSTLELFAYEYSVPWLSPYVAAVLATAGELLLPPLLVLGLLTRPVTIALFVFNIVAMISYPDISPAGIKDHYLWGFGFATLFFIGAGVLSLDHLMRKRFAQLASAHA